MIQFLWRSSPSVCAIFPKAMCSIRKKRKMNIVTYDICHYLIKNFEIMLFLLLHDRDEVNPIILIKGEEQISPCSSNERKLKKTHPNWSSHGMRWAPFFIFLSSKRIQSISPSCFTWNNSVLSAKRVLFSIFDLDCHIMLS